MFVTDSAWATSVSRPAIWQHMETAVALLTGAVKVYAVWISGSYVSEKLSPRDIDVAFLISEEDRLARSVPEKQVIESFITRKQDPLTGKPIPAHGLLVDSFIIDWAPHALLPRGITPEHQAYALNRGYWDDLWCRKRGTPKSQPDTRADALPQRGYLEVSLNDYT